MLKKHRPHPEQRKTGSQKETIVISEKGTKIVVKSEIVGMSSKSFKDRHMEKIEEASKREYEVTGTDIEPEYDDLDMEEEKAQVKMLTKNEQEFFHQFKEFYTTRNNEGQDARIPIYSQA